MWKHSVDWFVGTELEMCRKMDDHQRHYEILSVQLVETFVDLADLKHRWLFVMRKMPS